MSKQPKKKKNIDDGMFPVISVAEIDTVIKSQELANAFINTLKAGHVDPIDFAVKRKLILDAFDAVYDDPEVKGIITDAVAKYGKQKAVAHGAEVSIRSVGKYDYKADPTWRNIKERMMPVERELKEQEEKIKTATQMGASIIDQATGQVLAEPVPCPKTDSIVVKLKK